MPTPLLVCPVCAASVDPYGRGPDRHVDWHAATGTLNGATVESVRDLMGRRAQHAAADDDDAAQTITLPPVRESLGPRRRPPAPVIAQLTEHADLTRALLAELAAYDEQDDQR